MDFINFINTFLSSSKLVPGKQHFESYDDLIKNKMSDDSYIYIFLRLMDQYQATK